MLKKKVIIVQARLISEKTNQIRRCFIYYYPLRVWLVGYSYLDCLAKIRCWGRLASRTEEFSMTPLS